MNQTICYTSANLGYLDRALLLEASLRRHCPEWHVVLVLVDEFPSDPTLVGAIGRFDEVIEARSLFGDSFSAWIFGHDVVEACTAVKGAALRAFLDREPGCVVYLDPDIMVFGDLAGLLEGVKGASIALTPHQLTPDRRQKSVEDNELGSLRTGVFNLGFLATWPSAEGREFASWWAARLQRYCVDDASRGLFTDQKWLDHAPVFFPSMTILRDPGMNVASWNLSQRDVAFEADGRCTVNGEPLIFWHFTKALSVGPMMTLRYGARSRAVAELWRFYLETLQREKSGIPTVDWAYAKFSDGTVIPEIARQTYRSRADLQATFPDPFLVAGGHSYRRWLVDSGTWPGAV